VTVYGVLVRIPQWRLIITSCPCAQLRALIFHYFITLHLAEILGPVGSLGTFPFEIQWFPMATRSRDLSLGVLFVVWSCGDMSRPISRQRIRVPKLGATHNRSPGLGPRSTSHGAGREADPIGSVVNLVLLVRARSACGVGRPRARHTDSNRTRQRAVIWEWESLLDAVRAGPVGDHVSLKLRKQESCIGNGLKQPWAISNQPRLGSSAVGSHLGEAQGGMFSGYIR
jgi:hypothetical protein